MLLVTYYALNYAGIIGRGLSTARYGCGDQQQIASDGIVVAIFGIQPYHLML